jgi:DNA helicase-2/ATP-dependent DNA helicase PcrA
MKNAGSYVAVTRAKDELTLFAPMVKRTPEGGMFPVEPSVFVKEVPKELMNIRRTYTPMQNLGYGNSSYGYSRSGYSKNPYSSSYGSSYKPKPKPTYTTTWRR